MWQSNARMNPERSSRDRQRHGTTGIYLAGLSNSSTACRRFGDSAR